MSVSPKLTPMVRLQTAPTGPGEDMELPKYFIKLHETALTGPGANRQLRFR